MSHDQRGTPSRRKRDAVPIERKADSPPPRRRRLGEPVAKARLRLDDSDLVLAGRREQVQGKNTDPVGRDERTGAFIELPAEKAAAVLLGEGGPKSREVVGRRVRTEGDPGRRLETGLGAVQLPFEDEGARAAEQKLLRRSEESNDRPRGSLQNA